jgi:hypothetical protein
MDELCMAILLSSRGKKMSKARKIVMVGIPAPDVSKVCGHLNMARKLDVINIGLPLIKMSDLKDKIHFPCLPPLALLDELGSWPPHCIEGKVDKVKK